MTTGRMIAGTLVAVAAGAALGVLFAPDKGSTTRKKLVATGNKYIGSIKDSAGEYATSLEETYESAKGTAFEMADRVKVAVDVLGGDGTAKHTRRA